MKVVYIFVGLRDWFKFQKDMFLMQFRGMMAESAGFSKRLTIQQQLDSMMESVRLSEALITLLLFRVFLPKLWYFQVFMVVAVVFRFVQLTKLLTRLRREDRKRLERIDVPDE